MLRLSAFADEIGPDIDEQIAVCRSTGVTHFELRSVNKINVLDLGIDLRATVKAKMRDAGLGVVSIGSPIGKVKITDDWATHFDRFKLAVDAAMYFDAPLIRLFSYYPADTGGDFSRHRDEVLRRMSAKAEYVRSLPITLVHENEKDIFGEKGRACLDLMTTVNSPKLRSAFDFANFVQAKENPADNWPLLKAYTAHIHIKDAKMGDGSVVPAGKGDGQIGPIVADAFAAGYRGFLSLEPHLKVAGHSHGETGPELFRLAVDSLRAVCRQYGIPLST